MCEEIDLQNRWLKESINSKKKLYSFIFVFGILLHQMYIYGLSNPIRASSHQIPLGEPLASIE